MKINHIEVHGLLGREDPISCYMNSDINIVTGRNGAGKTTLLKLLWYIISGNISLAIREIEFSSAKIITDKFVCNVVRHNRVSCEVDIYDGDAAYNFEDLRDGDGDVIANAEDVADSRLKDYGSSVFFPTFRRIEGGFSMTRNRSAPNIFPTGPFTSQKGDIEEALIALSRRLTKERNVFVSAISTVDINSLLLRQYADLSEKSNDLQRRTSNEIIDAIKSYESEASQTSSDIALKNIREMIEQMEGRRDQIMSPLDAVRGVVEKLFTHTGIKIGGRISFGDAANAVNSELLSAGEKQMLSFICYNAFYKDSVIFIDEPELSLHVDWQRQLFPIMESQGNNNQFIIATHSPFIYSKYPDKEIVISEVRGDEGDQ